MILPPCAVVASDAAAELPSMTIELTPFTIESLDGERQIHLSPRIAAGFPSMSTVGRSRPLDRSSYVRFRSVALRADMLVSNLDGSRHFSLTI